MAQRKVQVCFKYQFGKRGVLLPADRFRVRGGPVYVTNDGRKIPMRERGEFIFIQFCRQGAAAWLEARRAESGEHVILWVGKPGPSPVVPNLRRRPYQIVRVRGAKQSRTKGATPHARKCPGPSRRAALQGATSTTTETGPPRQEP